MSHDVPPVVDVGYVVDLTLPVLPIESRDRLVAALHRADRNLAVGVGREGDALRLILMIEVAEEDAARRQATSLVKQALESVGLEPAIASIERITARTLSPGRPRRVSASAQIGYRVLVLPDGRALHAAHDGPLSDWTAYLDDAREGAWKGRDLLAVLGELLELPHGRKDRWVYDIIGRLAGRETSLGTRYACPCCDCFTLEAPPSGSFAICPVCGWEDDNVQFADVDYAGGANRSSLREARESFRRTGASEARREPRDREHDPRHE